jgi:hypothetical protein
LVVEANLYPEKNWKEKIRGAEDPERMLISQDRANCHLNSKKPYNS